MRNLLAFLCFLTLAFVAMPHAAVAAGNYYNADAPPEAEAPAAEAPAATDDAETAADLNAISAIEKPQPSHNFVVTSVSKCYAKLDRKDALEIQRSYIKPYEECQRRLAAKIKKDQNVKAGDAPKGTDKADDKADDKAAKKAEADTPAAKASLTSDSLPFGFYRIGKSQAPVPAEQPNNADKRDKTPTGNK